MAKPYVVMICDGCVSRRVGQCDDPACIFFLQPSDELPAHITEMATPYEQWLPQSTWFGATRMMTKGELEHDGVGKVGWQLRLPGVAWQFNEETPYMALCNALDGAIRDHLLAQGTAVTLISPEGREYVVTNLREWREEQLPWLRKELRPEMCEWCDQPVMNGLTHGENECFCVACGMPFDTEGNCQCPRC